MTFDWVYLFSLFSQAAFWNATLLVVKLSLATWVIGIIAGFILAQCKQSTFKALRFGADLYIWFLRSCPLLVLLIFTYNLPQVFPSTRAWLGDPFIAGLVALVLSETAYIAEIHRAGLSAVARGQIEAGKALGIRYLGIQRMIIIPQAFRVALPALINEYISITKLTSLVSVISLVEILQVGQRLYTQNFLILETLTAVALYYVLIVTVFDALLRMLERYLDIYRRRPALLQRAEIAQAHEANEKTEPHSEYALELTSGYKSYGKKTVIHGIDLKIKWGEVVSIIGPSGSGKTTLIRCLNGLETLDRGRVTLLGQPFLGDWEGQTTRRSMDQQIVHIGMVFQSFNLIAHRTVLDNLMIAPLYHAYGNREALRARSLAMLEKVGLVAFAYQYPHQLSGGQQQRVAIARALMMQPSVMLFDEPTSALDPELVAEVLKVISQLAQEGMTMLIVTHEMDFAFNVSDRVIYMEEGRIVHEGKPADLLAQETSPRLRKFIEKVSLAT